MGHLIRGSYPPDWPQIATAVKEAAGWRCERCGHPNEKPWKAKRHKEETVWTSFAAFLGKTEGSYLRCAKCKKRLVSLSDYEEECHFGSPSPCDDRCTHPTDGKQRVLTVDHLDGDKSNCSLWNLAALCQVCHLQVQGRIRMEQGYAFEHTTWMRPHVEGMLAAQAAGEWPK